MSTLAQVVSPQSMASHPKLEETGYANRELETFLAKSSEKVRDAAHSFVLGVKLATDGDSRQTRYWYDRLATDLSGLDPQTPEEQLIARIRRLKEDVVVSVIRPANYAKILRLWLWTVLLGILTSLLIGDQSLLTACEGLAKGFVAASGPDSNLAIVVGRAQEFCGSVQGHFNGYIAFRYAAFGTLLGGALFGSFSTAKAQFVDGETVGDSLTRPVLRGIIALALAYVLSMLVAGEKLDFDLLGFAIKSDRNAAGDPGFRNAISLFVIGLSAAMAADVYLRRLVESFRASAETAFVTTGKK